MAIFDQCSTNQAQVYAQHGFILQIMNKSIFYLQQAAASYFMGI